LSAEDPNGLKNFLRMDMASFNELFEIVTPLIKRRDTLMRNSISPAERLALTLQFLATSIHLDPLLTTLGSGNDMPRIDFFYQSMVSPIFS
jgi:hypothetical protein